MLADQPPTGIVTPEAVLLEFENASVGSRGIAKFIDLLVQLLVLLLLVFVVSAGVGLSGTGSTLAAVILFVGMFLILFCYPLIIEPLWDGKTLGKAAMGLRVVTKDGGRAKFRHAAVRGIVAIAEVYLLPVIAIMTSATSRDSQRLGDMFGGTIVIRERKAKAAATSTAVAFPPPPGLEGYVYSLDVGTITAEQYQVVRSFLTRVYDLTPQSRMALAIRLANPIAISLEHEPPPNLGPELFLACIASAYQLHHGGPAAEWVTGWQQGWGYPPGAYPGGATAGGAPGGAYPGGAYPAGGAPGGSYPGGGYPGGGYPGGGYPGGGYPGGGYPGGHPGAAYPGAPPQPPSTSVSDAAPPPSWGDRPPRWTAPPTEGPPSGPLPAPDPGGVSPPVDPWSGG